MNCAGKLLKLENYYSQQSSSIYTTSHHRNQVQKVVGAREIKSDLEFRYQIIVSSIQFRNGFAKFMIRIVSELTIYRQC